MDFMPWLIIFLIGPVANIKQSTGNIKESKLSLKKIIYLGDTHITCDCNRSDMCIPWPIGVVAGSSKLLATELFYWQVRKCMKYSIN